MYYIVAAIKDEVTDLLGSEDSHLIFTGVGKLQSLMTLTEWYHRQTNPISVLINLGTVGSEKIPTGELVEVTRVFQRDTTFFSEPIPLITVTSLPKVSCGSADRVSSFGANDPWDVVDMELYSLAFFCRQKKIPLVSIKYVTDRNDHSVYKEWKKQLPKASQALSHFWIQQKGTILSTSRS